MAINGTNMHELYSEGIAYRFCAKKKSSKRAEAQVGFSRCTLACVRRADLLPAERNAARGAMERRVEPLKLLARAGAVAWPKHAARSAAACVRHQEILRVTTSHRN